LLHLLARIKVLGDHRCRHCDDKFECEQDEVAHCRFAVRVLSPTRLASVGGNVKTGIIQ